MSAVVAAVSHITQSVFGRRIRLAQAAFPLALVALIVIGASAYPSFRTVANFRNVLTFAAIPCIIALGQTVVVLGRGVDLSVGSMVALSGAIFARLYTGGMSFWLSFIGTLFISIGIGAIVNGVIITKLKVSFIIVTLGTFAIFRSQATVLVSGNSIIINNGTLDNLANGSVDGIPIIIILAAGVYVLTLMTLRGTAYGRAVYAVGANPVAARLAGIPVDSVLIVSYALCAGLAAFAGLLTVGELGSAQPTAGTGAELTAIASVLLGGTRFSGGHGGASGTIVGVLFLGLLTNVLIIAGVSSFWQGTASGFVLITAVAADRSRRD